MISGFYIRWVPTILLNLPGLAFVAWALRDAIRRSTESWEVSGRRRWLWILIIVGFFLVFWAGGVLILFPAGAGAYWAVATRRNQRAATAPTSADFWFLVGGFVALFLAIAGLPVLFAHFGWL